jgi:hypothetical protein
MGKYHITAGLQKLIRKTWWYGAAVVVLQLSLLPAVCVAAGAISQGYNTNAKDISKGTLLSLTETGSSSVEPANSTANLSNLVGVAADKPLIELSNSGGNNTQVVVGGSTEALVSDVNGEVRAGDKITASPLSGIGMKALESSEIVGTARANLDSITTVDRQIEDKDGQKKTVKVGLLPITVNVTYYSAAMSQGTFSSFVPPFLQSIANTVAGRQVSPLRVLLGASALLLGFSAVIVILYTSIRNGLISLGRNPLAQGALRKGLVDVVIAAVGLLVVTTVLVYVTLAI